MKLLCVNTRRIEIIDKNTLRRCSMNGEDLVENKEYNTKGEAYIANHSHLCYYIEGLGQKLVCRFTKVIEEPVKEEIIWSKKEEFCLN